MVACPATPCSGIPGHDRCQSLHGTLLRAPVRVGKLGPLSPATVWGSLLAGLMLLLNGTGILFDRSSGPYIAALVWQLFMAGVLFVRLVVIPAGEIHD